jgi:type VI secretion system protein ImpL
MSVWEKWHASLEPVYPFADSPKDAKLKDFTEFFAPEKGALWAFYDENLSGSIQRSGDSFTAARRFDSGVNYEAPFLDKCLGKGAEVTKTVFGDGAEPVVEFEVNLHSVSPNVSEVRLSIDGKQHVYRNTPEEWLQSQWPAKEAETPGARVRIRGLRQLDEEIIRDGDFGFFRLLDAASAVEPDPEAGDDGRTLIATWDLPSEKAFFKLHVRTKRRDVKLGSHLFRDVACPRVIATVAK